MHTLFNMQWDQSLLRLINTRWTNAFFDWLMPFLRNSDCWIPLYFFLILFVLMNYGKTGWWWLLAAACTPILTDLISSGVIKENIPRLRPCNEPAIAGWLRTIPGLAFPKSSSFTSSHAANHFGLAMFLFCTMKNIAGRYSWLFFVWAAFICYAQVYVGVHYPLDIICGAMVGLLIGYFTSFVFNRQTGGLQPAPNLI